MSVKNRKRERAWEPRETMRNQRKQAGGEGQTNARLLSGPCLPSPALLWGAGTALPGPLGLAAGYSCLQTPSLPFIPALVVASPFSTSLTSSELSSGITSSSQAFPPAQTKQHLSALTPKAPAITSPYVSFSQGSDLSKGRKSSPISTSTSLAQASKMRAQ